MPKQPIDPRLKRAERVIHEARALRDAADKLPLPVWVTPEGGVLRQKINDFDRAIQQANEEAECG